MHRLKRFFVLALVVMVAVQAFPKATLALTVSAKSAVLIEQSTGKVLYEKNAHERLPMASTTKIMTAICAIEHADLAGVVTVDARAVGVEGSSMYLEKGEHLTLEDLIYGLMLSSGNDAAVAIALHISGDIDSFAQLMNETAQKIGAKNTSFRNPNGLDHSEHYTTAYDLALITRYGMEFEKFREIVATPSKKVPWESRGYDRSLTNHNKMLKIYEGADGVKTGFTKKSGRCLVSSATRDGMQAIAVTLNAPDDWNDHTHMLDYAFDTYHMEPVFQKGDYVRTVTVKNSEVKEMKMITTDGVEVPVKHGEKPDVVVELRTPGYLDAPVGFEDEMGGVEVYFEGNLLKKISVVSAAYAPVIESMQFAKNLKHILQEWISFETDYMAYGKRPG